jgi:surfeit locus 1 family protein
MARLEALSLPRDSGQDLPEMEYRSVVASGRYDFSQQVALRNQSYRDQYGFHLLTPLVLDDGTAILVDRGWIPAENEPAAWSAYNEPAGRLWPNLLACRGLGGSHRGSIRPGPSGRLHLWTFPNIPRIQEQVSYQLLPVYLQVDVDENDTRPPIPYQPGVDLTEGPHQSYAMQWFSFATLLLVGYPFYVHQHSGHGPGISTPLEET